MVALGSNVAQGAQLSSGGFLQELQGSMDPRHGGVRVRYGLLPARQSSVHAPHCSGQAK